MSDKNAIQSSQSRPGSEMNTLINIAASLAQQNTQTQQRLLHQNSGALSSIGHGVIPSSSSHVVQSFGIPTSSHGAPSAAHGQHHVGDMPPRGYLFRPPNFVGMDGNILRAMDVRQMSPKISESINQCEFMVQAWWYRQTMSVDDSKQHQLTLYFVLFHSSWLIRGQLHDSIVMTLS